MQSWSALVVVAVAVGVISDSAPVHDQSVLAPTDEDSDRDRLLSEDRSAADRRGFDDSKTPAGGVATDGQIDVSDQEWGDPMRGSSAPVTDLPLEILNLRDRVRDCLSYYWQRPQNAADTSPWSVPHAAIGFGVDTQVVVSGQRVNAIGWLCWNRTCGGRQLFGLGKHGLEPFIGPGVQGHSGQFLSVLAFARVPRDYELRIEETHFTVNDLVEYEKRTCRPGSDLTFKLIGLVHYVPPDEVWNAERGGEWSIARLIREELAQPVNGAACGGTHRLMALSYAVRKREKRGEPLDGQWLRAKKYVDAYHDYVFNFQNDDGGFSTRWFRARANEEDINRRLETTGHVVEWLVVSLPHSQLSDSRVVRSVDYLVRMLSENRTRDWPAGPQGHALHALAVYDGRISESTPGQRTFLQAAK